MATQHPKSTLYKIISKLCVDNNTTIAQLAISLHKTPQGMYRRLQTGKFSYEELQAIAEKLNCTFSYQFTPKKLTQERNEPSCTHLNIAKTNIS